MKLKITIPLDTELDHDILMVLDDMSSTKRNRFIKDCIREHSNTEEKLDEILRILKSGTTVSIEQKQTKTIKVEQESDDDSDLLNALRNIGI